MVRRGRIWCAVLTASVSCNAPIEIAQEERMDMRISISMENIITRASDPDEQLLTDLTVMIFDTEGCLEDSRWFSKADLDKNIRPSYDISLIKGKKYNMYACANIGRRFNVRSMEELMDLKCNLVYPDDYREGIPMAGKIEEAVIDDETSEIRIPLERMMAKISLCIDRRKLSEDVTMNVSSVRIGNCPKEATLFTSNSVKEHSTCFPVGFMRSESECSILNRNITNGISGSVSLYMLENMQGNFGIPGIEEESDKVFDRLDPRQETCSYVELWLDYESPSHHSIDKPLIYRFYLGKDTNSLDVERNCHYHITIIPEDDGLTEDSWRVDKTGIQEKDQDIFFEMIPSGYLQGTVGETVHVMCRFQPEDAEFDIGLEELEEDRQRGLYDYIIDEDGHGVTLSLKSPGTGILYMTVGEPVNESGLLVLEINRM